MKWLAIFLFLFPLLSYAQDDDDITGGTLGPGFVEVQPGYFKLLGDGRKRLDDAFVAYLNLGFSPTHEFKAKTDFEPLRIGPKIGTIFGRIKATAQADVSYTVSFNTRYSFGDKGDLVRLYVEGGPGAFSYGGTAFMVDVGTGIRFQFGTGTFGFQGDYKQVFGSNKLDNGYEILGVLGYQF